MSYLALYRRYRPNTFDKLVGQEHIVKTLVNQIENDKLGHAYLFTGTRGTGKTTAAKIFARAVNCMHPVNGSPCGECEVCKALADSSNIDVVEMDAASNNGVNEIRDLREKVQYAPVSCKYKVFIIDEVHMLSGSAFNALLKTLEEPPKHAIFILATTEAHKIPATILSRCMRFDFRLIETERIARLIEDIYTEQGVNYEKEAVYAIASAGEGSIRDALSVADVAISYAKPKLTYDAVTEILGSTNFEVISEFVQNMIVGNAGVVLSLTDKLCGMGKSVGVLAKDVTGHIRDILVIKTCANPNAILNLPDNKFVQLQGLSKITTEDRLIRILEVFAEIENTLKYSVHPRIVFETAAVKATRPDADYDMGALMARISELEKQVKDGALENKTVMIVFNVVLGLSGVYAIVGIIVGLTRKGKEKGKKKRGNVDVVESEIAEVSVNQNEQTAPPVAPVQPYTTPVENSVSNGVKYYEVRQNPSLVMAEYPDRYVLFRKTANGLVKIRTDYK